jgi:hypothetical protein
VSKAKRPSPEPERDQAQVSACGRRSQHKDARAALTTRRVRKAAGDVRQIEPGVVPEGGIGLQDAISHGPVFGLDEFTEGQTLACAFDEQA